jgi:DNA-binding response OmpR family regulator
LNKKKENEQDEKEDNKKKRILIVDDEVEITNSFALSLEDSGLFEVDTYNDPLVAMSNYRPDFYDLLLLDIRMPKMNGFELYQKIKEIDNNVKVCFISAYDVDYAASREQNPSLELDCFISKQIIRKPIEISKLIERIESELLT